MVAGSGDEDDLSITKSIDVGAEITVGEGNLIIGELCKGEKKWKYGFDVPTQTNNCRAEPLKKFKCVVNQIILL